jgi:hypothetical protein
MATKSILKTVCIRSKKSALRLVKALESTSAKRPKQISFSRPYSDASREDIRKMFPE